MFKKDNRYVTRGVNEEVDIRLQLIMWSMIDKLEEMKEILNWITYRFSS